MTTPYIDPNVIFASDAPANDKPNFNGDPKKGWDITRNNNGRPVIPQMNFVDNRADLKTLYIHQNGAALPWMPDVEYALHAPVTKSDGTLVQSTVAGNKTNPNVDMTGWEVPSLKTADNLSDVPNKAAARSNLSVYSQTEVDTAISNATPTIPNATETIAGKAKIATTAIAQAGVNDADFITAKKLRDALNASGDAPIGVFRSYVAFGYDSGVIVVYSSLNVSSVIRNSAGVYTIKFTKSLPNSNYGVLATCASISQNDINRTVGVSYTGDNPTLKTTSQLMVIHGFSGVLGVSDSKFITVGVL